MTDEDRIYSRGARNMFVDEFRERRDLEQYFWTRDCVSAIQRAVQGYADDCCGLCVPTLAVAYHQSGQEIHLLDIDTRFDFLPLFRYFDLLRPHEFVCSGFNIIVFDPPFFYIPMDVLHAAVVHLVKGKSKLLIGFLKREENVLLDTFRDFELRPTNFQLEYSHVKPNKWKNYCLYSNVDLPGIKRLKR
jgi:Probable N6-adenine methyltransferase